MGIINGVQLRLYDRIDRIRLDVQWSGGFECLAIILVYNINISFVGSFPIMDSNGEYEFKYTLCRYKLLSTYRIPERLHHINTSNNPTIVLLHHQYHNPFLKRYHKQCNHFLLLSPIDKYEHIPNSTIVDSTLNGTNPLIFDFSNRMPKTSSPFAENKPKTSSIFATKNPKTSYPFSANKLNTLYQSTLFGFRTPPPFRPKSLTQFGLNLNPEQLKYPTQSPSK